MKIGRMRAKVRERAVKEILMPCSPGSLQDTERFPAEIRQEHGVLEMRGDTVTRFIF